MAHTAFLLLVAAAAAAPAAYSTALDQRAIDEAVSIGHSYSDAARERFHRGYRVPVGRAPVDYLEVITPFRRLVITAEERARIGERYLPQKDAHAVLAQQADGVDIVVELTFHPLNTYVGVPDYDVALEAGSRVVRSRNPRRLSRFTPRVAGVPVAGAFAGATQRSEPLLGGTVIARFDRADVDVRGGYDVVVRDAGKELARARVELGPLR